MLLFLSATIPCQLVVLLFKDLNFSGAAMDQAQEEFTKAGKLNLIILRNHGIAAWWVTVMRPILETTKHIFWSCFAAFWSGTTYVIAGEEALKARDSLYSRNTDFKENSWFDIVCWPFTMFRAPVRISEMQEEESEATEYV